MITKQRLVEVDNKVRTDPKYPVGFMDVLTIPKSKDAVCERCSAYSRVPTSTHTFAPQFRVLYDVKGRFVLQKVDSEQAKFKLAKVRSVGTAVNGVPILTTHDGRTIRFPDPLIARGDTIKFDLVENKIVDFIKFKPGTTVMVTGGANTGRVGKAVDVERHPGSFDIIHVKDGNGNTFATRLLNAFVVGRADEIAIGLPKAKGIRLPLIQDREQRIQTVAKQRQGKKRN